MQTTFHFDVSDSHYNGFPLIFVRLPLVNYLSNLMWTNARGEMLWANVNEGD